MAEHFEGDQVCIDPELFAFIEPLCLIAGSADTHELTVQLHPNFLAQHRADTSLRVVVSYGDILLADLRGATISCDGCIRVVVTGTQQLPPGVLDVLLIAVPPGQQDCASPGQLISCTLLPILPGDAAEEMALLFEDMMMAADVSAPRSMQQGAALPTASVLCEPAMSDILLSAASHTALACCTPTPSASARGDPSASASATRRAPLRTPWFVDLARAGVWAHHYQPLLADLRLALGPGVLRSGTQTLALGTPTHAAAAAAPAPGSAPGGTATTTAAPASSSGRPAGGGEITAASSNASCSSSCGEADSSCGGGSGGSSPQAGSREEEERAERNTALFLLLCRAEVMERLSTYFEQNDLPACCDMVLHTSTRSLFSPPAPPPPAHLPHQGHGQQHQQGHQGHQGHQQCGPQRSEEEPAAQPPGVARLSLRAKLGLRCSGKGSAWLREGWLGKGMAGCRALLRAPYGGKLREAVPRARGKVAAGGGGGAQQSLHAACLGVICGTMLLLAAVCWYCLRWCGATSEMRALCRPVLLHWAVELLPHVLLAACPAPMQRHRKRLQLAAAVSPMLLMLLMLLTSGGLLPYNVLRSHLGGWANVLCFALLQPSMREARFSRVAGMMTVLGACKWWLLGASLPNHPPARLLLLAAYGSSSLLALLLDCFCRRSVLASAGRPHQQQQQQPPCTLPAPAI